MCVPQCVYVYHMCVMPVDARRGRWILLEQKFQACVSCHISAGNQTPVLCKSNEFS